MVRMKRPLPGPTFRASMFLVSIVALSALGSTSASASEPLAIRVPAADLRLLGEIGIEPETAIDYGSYYWLRITPAEHRALVASGARAVVVVGAARIRVPGYDFDPIREEEPVVATELRSSGEGDRLRLVQLLGPPRSEWLQSLEASGQRVLQYYPHLTYLVWGSAAATESLEGAGFVRWSGDFHPAYKLGSDLDTHGDEPRKVTAIFYDDGDRDSTLRALALTGAEVTSVAPAQPDRVLWRAVLLASPTAYPALARVPQVVWLGGRRGAPRLEDEMSSQIVAGNHPGGVPALGYGDHLDDLGFDGTDVIWAIADTGVDYDHPDLGPRIVGGFSVPGADCSAPGQPGTDCNSPGGHGTHVAGIVGADATAGFTDSDGFLYGLGVAPGHSIFALNIFGSDQPLELYSQVAVQGGAVGVNNSWTTGEGTAHGYQDSERTFDFMVRDGDFDTPEIAEPHIVVFSAGNSGSSPMTLTAPKECKNAIVTAGTQNFRTSGNIDAMYNSSSRGPAVDGRYVPTIAAPGQSIASTRNDLGGLCASPIANTNNLYSFCTGTSMAAPHASGAVVLLTEWWRQANGGADPSPAMAKALLINTAVDISSTPSIPNFDEGWGRIHSTAILDPAVPTLYFDQETLLDDSGEHFEQVVRVADPAQPLKVTLVWSDAPGSLGANPALVNDLDLLVTQGPTAFRGNQFTGGWSNEDMAVDSLNNMENVFVEAPGYSAKITVLGTSIAGDGVPLVGDSSDQDFALVCSNCVPALFADGFESGDTSAWSRSNGEPAP